MRLQVGRVEGSEEVGIGCILVRKVVNVMGLPALLGYLEVLDGLQGWGVGDIEFGFTGCVGSSLLLVPIVVVIIVPVIISIIPVIIVVIAVVVVVPIKLPVTGVVVDGVGLAICIVSIIKIWQDVGVGSFVLVVGVPVSKITIIASITIVVVVVVIHTSIVSPTIPITLIPVIVIVTPIIVVIIVVVISIVVVVVIVVIVVVVVVVG